MNEAIRMDFYIDNTQYAQRESEHVPNVGDEVRFKGVAYNVSYRIWIYDEMHPRVALSIKEASPEDKGDG